MSRGTNWTQEDVDAHLRKFKGHDNSTVSPTDVESHHPPRRKGPDEADQVHPKYRIQVHHRSWRLADSTGRSHKAAVDGIVRGGILRDDSTRYLEGITETYEQGELEETILTVVEIFDYDHLARTNSRKILRDQETFRTISK